MNLPEFVDLVSVMREAQIDRDGNNSAATRMGATVAEKMVDKALTRFSVEEALADNVRCAMVITSPAPTVAGPAPQVVEAAVNDSVDLTPVPVEAQQYAAAKGRSAKNGAQAQAAPPWA